MTLRRIAFVLAACAASCFTTGAGEAWAKDKENTATPVASTPSDEVVVDPSVSIEASTEAEAVQPAFTLGRIPVSSAYMPSSSDAHSEAALEIGSKYPITFSGMLKADLIWGDGRVNSNDNPMFAVPDTSGDEFFDMTVQHSQLAADWDGPEILYDGKVDARVELDFRSLSQDPVNGKWNNSRISVRQLYVNMSFDTWSFLAGQAWDIFSPLNTDSLNNNSNLWFGGNAGFRRPQFRLQKWFDVSDEQRLMTKFSVNANIGAPDPNGNAFNTGEDSGKPNLQAAIQYSLPFLTERPMTIGASGLLGEDEADGIDGDISQSGYGFDITLPITDQVSLKGEWAHGENTAAFLLGGGFDATGDEIETNAGWGQLTIDATEEIQFNLIAGQERLSSAGAGSRDRNTVYGANVKYSLHEDVLIGAEFQRLDTEYNGASDEEVNLGWLSVIFNF